MSPAESVEMSSMNPAQGGGGGVSRLVAQFENKGYVPPLPPRPINNAHHQTHHLGTSPSISSHFGSLNSVAQSHRISSPVNSSGESQYGSLGIHSPPTPSPIATSMGRSGSVHYGSFHDIQQVHSPGIGTPFGSMDGFMNTARVNSPMVSTPMVASPMVSTPTQTTPRIPGTPGFEIWRPPPSMEIKQESKQEIKQEPSDLTNATNFAGYFRPPVPTTPKPVVNTGNQFILEFNPSAAKAAKGKAPAKPPRPRLPPRKPTTVTQTQASAREMTPAQAPTPRPVPAAAPTPGPMSPPPKPPRPSEPPFSSSSSSSTPSTVSHRK